MKILIVDDHRYNRELMGFILSDHDFDYVVAEDGQRACEVFRETPDIDLVLMDVNMPVMDGYEATKQIKQLSGDRLVPVVFVTALDDSETLTKCLNVGGDDFVAKPVNESVLLAKLIAHQRTINIHRQMEETNHALEYHQRLMDREHAIVEHVFQNGLKSIDIDCNNLRFHVSPMSMFNGDLYLAAPSPSGGLYVLLGDFTGHGLSAAIGCLPVSNIFTAMTEKQASVGDIAREINTRLQSLLPTNMFFCASLIELNQRGDRLSFWAGGMNDMLVLDREGALDDRLCSQHMPLGVLEEDEFDDGVTVFHTKPESRVFIYTDGVIETCDPQGEYFGEERLEALLAGRGEDNIAKVFAAVKDFQGRNEQQDDISMVELLCAQVTHRSVETDGDYCTLDAQSRNERDALPWSLSLNLQPAHLRDGQIVSEFLKVVNNIQGVGNHRDLLFTLLTELYNNALDHGLLKLDSTLKSQPEGFAEYYQRRKSLLLELDEGEILFEVKVEPAREGQPTRLIFRFTDTGEGFDSALVSPASEDDELTFGRGMDMVRSLCQSVEYSNQGRTVEASYRLE